MSESNFESDGLAQRPRNGSQRTRIALYSHDTQGLGHIRRNLLIANAVSHGEESPVILMLSGVHEAAGFAMPNGVDCITLPSFGKNATGGYYPRTLGVSMNELVTLRSRTILSALSTFVPDVLVVDKVPVGAMGELVPALRALKRGGCTRFVLGLRDVLDDSESVSREWHEREYDDAIRSYYDRIWIYGDRSVFDPIKEYSFAPDIRALVRFSGYLNPFDEAANGGSVAQGSGDALYDAQIGDGSFILCVVGGGNDGYPLADAFLRSDLPRGMTGVLVTGPLMPQEARMKLRTLAAGRNARTLEFVTDPTPLLRRADRVVAMGGYNTMCEILALNKRALIVPRVRPRREQLIRAERFAKLGLVDMLHPDRLDHSALTSWFQSHDGPPPRADRLIDFNGTARLPELLKEVMTSPSYGKEIFHAAG